MLLEQKGNVLLQCALFEKELRRTPTPFAQKNILSGEFLAWSAYHVEARVMFKPMVGSVGEMLVRLYTQSWRD